MQRSNLALRLMFSAASAACSEDEGTAEETTEDNGAMHAVQLESGAGCTCH